MPRKPDVSQFKTFEEVAGRLDEIVLAVRDKDLSLERSLDLFDEAIALGSKAVDLVDTTEFSAAELEQMSEGDGADGGAGVEGEAPAEGVVASGDEPEAEPEAEPDPSDG